MSLSRDLSCDLKPQPIFEVKPKIIVFVDYCGEQRIIRDIYLILILYLPKNNELRTNYRLAKGKKIKRKEDSSARRTI